MKRRHFFVAAVMTIGAAVSRAQEPKRIPRIGLLWVSADGSPKFLEALRDGLRTRGYVEGKDIRIEDRYLVKRNDELSEAMQRLIRDKVDIVLVFGASALKTAAGATTTMPIVFNTAEDPVKEGFVASLARPGKNATGISNLSQGLAGKRLQILKEVLPSIRCVGVLSSGNYSESVRQNKGPAAALGVEVRFVDIPQPNEIERLVVGLERQGIDALAVTSITLLAYRKRVIAAIDKTRLPAIYGTSEYVEAGGLMSFGPNQSESFRKAASYIDRILKGAKPGDLAVEQSETLEMTVNLSAAQALGISIPQQVLMRVDRVIN